MDTVLEIKRDGDPVKSAAPNHYIFVVDVSGSMNNKLGSKSLLERVKV